MMYHYFLAYLEILRIHSSLNEHPQKFDNLSYLCIKIT